MAELVIANARLSYPCLVEPRSIKGMQSEESFSARILVEKTDAAGVAAIQKAVEEAKKAGVSSKWDGKMPAKIAMSISDGDLPNPNSGEAWGDECKGCWVIAAKAKADRRPKCYDKYKREVPKDEIANMFYSGCRVVAALAVYPYAVGGKKGLAVGLNGLMFWADDEPLGATFSASVFDQFAQDPAASMASSPVDGAENPWGV